MAPPMLEFSGDLVGRGSLSKGIAALIDHLRAKQRKPQLLAHDDGDFLYLILTLHRIPAASRLNPHLLPLPHPLFSSAADSDSAPSLCLLLDDRPKSSSLPSDAVLDRARSLSLPIADAITLSSLRADYRPYEARRKLCDSHDIFLADRRILPLLPRLLGKHFFKKKKIPLAIDLSRPGWPEQVRRCLSSSPLYLRSGTCCAVRIGRLAMDLEAIVDNAVAVLKEAMELVPQKWANLRSVHVKAVDSIALPVYQALPQTGLKITIAPRVEKDDEGEVVNAVEVKPKGSNKKNMDTKKKKKPKKSRGRIHELLQQINEDDAVMQEQGEEIVEPIDYGTVMHREDEDDKSAEAAEEEEEEEILVKKRKKGDGKKQKLTENRKNKKTNNEMTKEVPIAKDGEKKKKKNTKSKTVK